MSSMLGFFPTPLPDETLHSILSRYCRLSGRSSFSALKEDASDRVHFARAVGLPCGIGGLLKKIGLDNPISADLLIRDHTLAGYFLPFLSDAQADLAARQMEDGPACGLALKLGVVASTLAKFNRIRFCETCIRTDDREFGQPYWHRAHQLPGVWVCAMHADVLNVLDVGWTRQHLMCPFLPDDDAVNHCSSKPEIDSYTMSELHQIAVLSRSLMDTNLGPLGSEALRWHLRGKCAEKGLCINGRLNLRDLGFAVAQYFRVLPCAAEFQRLRSSTEKDPPVWITKLLRKPRGSHHPLKYLLLMRILGMRCDELGPVQNAHLRTILDSNDAMFNEEGDAKILQFPQGSWSLRKLAQLNESSLETVKCELIRRRIPFRQFPKVLTAEMVTNIHRRAAAGVSSTTIASELGVSLTSVGRVIRRAPEIKALRTNSCFKRQLKQARSAFLADMLVLKTRQCAGYTWLYHNDREWLSSVIEQARVARVLRGARVDWAFRDTVLSGKISEAATSLRARTGKPVRVSAARLGRELSATDDFEKHISHLPKCKKALAAERETPFEYMERKLRWAICESLRLKKSLSSSALQRLAGIRTRSMAFDKLRLRLLAETDSSLRK